MNNLTKKQKIALFGSVIYTALIGIGMYVSYHIRGIDYHNNKIMNTLWVSEVLMTLWTIFLTLKYFSWKEVGFVKVDKKQIWWFVPSLLIVSAMLLAGIYALFTNDLSSEQLQQISLIGFATFLVGFSEELMYRGIVFNAFFKTHSKLKTILISAVAFSLLHSVNIFGGLTFYEMLGQLLMTFLFGLFSALIFMRIKSIIPLIFFHWLWDFWLMADGVMNGKSLIGDISTAHIFIQFGLIIVLFIVLRKFKKITNTNK
ncbi:MAG: CPBP family intramembrane metalloprotease [Tenacibaculum sp.]|nr:CPBP family intramembrane metalloprotease [Tenacibaculum sp.]